MKLLIIEKNSLTATLIGHFLENERHFLDFSYDGKNGLEKIKKDYHDLVICDYVLPDMIGGEVIKQAKEYKPNLTYFFMVELDRLVDYSKYKLGTNDILKKPFNQSKLIKKINSYEKIIRSKRDSLFIHYKPNIDNKFKQPYI